MGRPPASGAKQTANKWQMDTGAHRKNTCVGDDPGRQCIQSLALKSGRVWGVGGVQAGSQRMSGSGRPSLQPLPATRAGLKSSTRCCHGGVQQHTGREQPQQVAIRLAGSAALAGGLQRSSLAAAGRGCGLLAKPLGDERREGDSGREAHGGQRLVCCVRDGKRAHRFVCVVDLRGGGAAARGEQPQRRPAAVHKPADSRPTAAAPLLLPSTSQHRLCSW